MNRPKIRRSRRIEFADTDASGRAHFTALLRHVEAVEHELLAELGIPLIDADGGWPRVRIECDFRSPLAAGDPIEVTVAVAAVGESSVEWSFEIAGPAGATAAAGKIVSVWVGPDQRPNSICQPWRALMGG